MDNRLRGNGNYGLLDLMNYSGSAKSAWILLENYLGKDYVLGKIIIEESKNEGWGVNY